METNQQTDPLSLLERLEKGESIESLAKATEATPPAAEPAPAATPPPVVTPDPVAPAPAPATPPAATTPEPPPAQETAEEKLRRLEAEHDELKKRFGGLRATRDERADKLQKEIDELKAKEAERERQAQLAKLKAEQPEGYEDFAPVLEHHRKVEQVMAPPPATAPKPSEPQAPDPSSWFNTVADAVTDFPNWMADQEFTSYVAGKLVKDGTAEKWKTNPAWVAANVKDFHAEFQEAKKNAAAQQRQQQQHLSGSGIPNGSPTPRPVTTAKTLTQSQLNHMLLEDARFKGKDFSESWRILQSEGYVIV
jgi:hypothetical protein